MSFPGTFVCPGLLALNIFIYERYPPQIYKNHQISLSIVWCLPYLIFSLTFDCTWIMCLCYFYYIHWFYKIYRCAHSTRSYLSFLSVMYSTGFHNVQKSTSLSSYQILSIPSLDWYYNDTIWYWWKRGHKNRILSYTNNTYLFSNYFRVSVCNMVASLLTRP